MILYPTSLRKITNFPIGTKMEKSDKTASSSQSGINYYVKLEKSCGSFYLGTYCTFLRPMMMLPLINSSSVWPENDLSPPPCFHFTSNSQLIHSVYQKKIGMGVTMNGARHCLHEGLDDTISHCVCMCSKVPLQNIFCYLIIMRVIKHEIKFFNDFLKNLLHF